MNDTSRTKDDCAHSKKVTTLPSGERVCVDCACAWYQGMLKAVVSRKDAH